LNRNTTLWTDYSLRYCWVHLITPLVLLAPKKFEMDIL
jgi:hypothetical protein